MVVGRKSNTNRKVFSIQIVLQTRMAVGYMKEEMHANIPSRICSHQGRAYIDVSSVSILVLFFKSCRQHYKSILHRN